MSVCVIKQEKNIAKYSVTGFKEGSISKELTNCAGEPRKISVSCNSK